MRGLNTEDKTNYQNYRSVDSNGCKSIQNSNESDMHSQKKLITDLRFELTNLKSEFTKLINKPADNNSALLSN